MRQAYIERALRDHPDRQEGLDVAGLAAAERRMQEVNGAWAVLGNREARAAYDAELGIVRVDEPVDEPADDEPVIDLREHERTPLRRFVPVAVFLAVALLFLLFTAYAGTPRS